MTISIKKLLAVAMCACGFSATAWSQTNLPLVAETDFSVKSGEKNYFMDIFSVDGYGKSMVSTSMRTYLDLTEGTASDLETSTFIDNLCYAVTPNPIRLDSLRFADNKDSGEWGLVVSNGQNGANTINQQKFLSFSVWGLKNGGDYQVEIEYCNPLSATFLEPNAADKKSPHLTSGYSCNLKVGVNSKDGEPFSISTSGGCDTYIVKKPMNANRSFGEITGNMLCVDLYTTMSTPKTAFMIKSIKVYAEVAPTIKGVSEVCVADNATPLVLKESESFKNVKYQWYKNGTPIAGATDSAFMHEPSKKVDGSTTYTCEITNLNGDKIKSNSFVVNDIICCMNDNGEPMSRKLIWQDDFGTFENDSTYWTWDYSDLSNPKKISQKASEKWVYALDDTIPGAKYNNPINGEGQYTVAANVTCVWEGAETGTQWQWQAQCFNGRVPSYNGWDFVPDHTYNGDAYGAMLFLNCGNKENEVIYSRTITNLEEKQYTAKCFINNFSAADNPVKIKIRLTDIHSKISYESETVSRYATTDGLAWKEVSSSVNLTGDSLLLEIISVAGGESYNKSGNDLILDDIQLWVCAEKETEQPINYFEGYNPSIIGEAKTCLLDSAIYAISEVKEDLVYYWSVDENIIGTGTSITVDASEEGLHTITCIIEDPLGNSISKSMNVVFVACCTNDKGKPVKQILIWQDDFGTFENDSTYWTWDYSDYENPKKVYHKSADSWVYALDDTIPGAKYNNPINGEGQYNVAANVTCAYDGAKTGTQWEWQAKCFNGMYPSGNGWNFVPDHTYNGAGYGAMLFLNCGNAENEVIYSKTITNLEAKQYTAKCYINNFSEAPNPVKIKMRLTDINSKSIYESETVSRHAITDGLSWKEVSSSVILTGDSLLLEIISVAGGESYNQMGNDLILDDIQLVTCDMSSETGVEATTAKSDDDLVNVYNVLGIMVKQNVMRFEATKGLKEGIYIVGGEKVIVR